MEMNPNHPVTRMTSDMWHKIAAVIMLKHGLTEVEITSEDVQMLGDMDKAIVADCRNGQFIIRVVSMEEGESLARKEGGLPV
jgi:predicted  nucleic acid-binding Zn-ribbon protein